MSFLNNIAVEYIDNDADGWTETARVVVNTGTTTFNKHEYKAYFADNGGNQIYEIRPPKRKYANGSVLTMEFDTWKLIKPEAKHAIISDDMNSINIDMNNVNNLVETIDIYRVQ